MCKFDFYFLYFIIHRLVIRNIFRIKKAFCNHLYKIICKILHKINLFLPLLRNWRDFFKQRNHFVQKFAVFNVEDKMLLCAVVRKSAFRVEFLHNRLRFRKFFHKNRVVAHKKNRLFVQVRHILAEHLAAVHLAVSFNLPAHKINVFFCSRHFFPFIAQPDYSLRTDYICESLRVFRSSELFSTVAFLASQDLQSSPQNAIKFFICLPFILLLRKCLGKSLPFQMI